MSLLPAVAFAFLAPATVLTNVHVVGPDGITTGQSIVIAGDKVVAVGPASAAAPPPDARVIDGRGAFVIPGLWEMHGHLASYEGGLPLLVAYGVTGVRDMGYANPRETEELLRWRREIAEGRRIGPRLVIAGPTVDGPRGYKSEGRLFVATPAEARAVVATVKARGADFVKVHDWVPPDAYAALVAAAREAGLVVAGHAPVAIPARVVAEAGQRSVEHLGSATGGFLLDTSRREAELRQELLERMDAVRRKGEGEKELWKWVGSAAHAQGLLEARDPAKQAALIDVFRRNGTFQCPTLAVMSPTARPRSDAEQRFVFASGRAACAAEPPPAPSSESKALFQVQLGIVAEFQRAGVGLLAGTDTTAPGAEAVEEFRSCDVPIAGLSLHEELEWLVDAGLTPAQAIAAATLEPARYFGEEATAGSVEAGRRADLVLLEANPLDDVRNTRRIRAVVAGGRFFDRAALDGLLEQAAADAKAK